MDKVLIVGCGDIGRRVARLELERGAEVTGLVRSTESAEKLQTLGIRPLVAELNYPDGLAEMATRGALVYYFAPPPGGGVTDPKMRSFCAAIRPGEEPQRVVYISTSGVYGDCGGELVTEETPANPQTTRARRRFDAETVLRQWGAERGVAVVILRVTGIYGPGRIPVNRLQDGHPLLRIEECSQTNRIHADDLAQVCVAAMAKGDAGEIFNVSDGHPSTMTEYFLAVAELAGLPRPPLVDMEEARRVMTPLMLSYLTESRRMDNRKMLEKLGVKLRYPSLEQGLKASLAQG
ncbi:NAD(P)-dependent oxidoreductase [Desulfuromonas versatilis]|uniref:NAD(P)-dependent oxidoreductase n=1 Tax=Desulfuromonas versatilis TaxID=2802975 RepID=A0ABN6DUQ8_9BACT|nr:SDR family oxidoreductase [Desulfuromonas versatilis]BCR03472.1 NAD(P)-dependent oxidoreductase [Desulfuromonas versatilis]